MKKPSARTYNSLVKILRQEIQEARKEIERRTVLLYWTTGKHINAFLAKDPGRGGYGEEFYQQLGEDIGIDYRTLYQAAQFERTYPKLDVTLPLSWSHYRYLCHLKTDAERRRWEKRILRDGLSVPDFLVLLSDRGQKKQAGHLKAPARGKLYHYRLIKSSKLISGPDVIYIDCGFKNYIEPPPGSRQDTTRIYRSAREDGRYTLKLSKAVKSGIYTYKAFVERVIDADTFVVIVHCGFGIIHRETLRLRLIDAPERKTTAGRRAIRWVKQELKNCPFVVIKTYKPDKYARYLTDVFYLPGEPDAARTAAAGRYLNGRMVEAGQARVWST